jgi:maltooligosyltrehalose trehalohydrolase
MPVATFPGRRGWGYDGLYTWAPHDAYGGPDGLARLRRRRSRRGPRRRPRRRLQPRRPGGDWLCAFGPWFTDRFGPTPWGDALDYRERAVREWAIQNAEQWLRDYHVDGLRLDAVHALADDSPTHVLAELAERVHAARAGALVISEMGRADFRPLEQWRHDAMWLDRLHHPLHVELTGEPDGYNVSFDGSMTEVADELRRPGGERLVVFAQNFDPASGDSEHRAFYERLLRLRRELPRELEVLRADDGARVLELRRGRARLVLDFGAETVELDA